MNRAGLRPLGVEVSRHCSHGGFYPVSVGRALLSPTAVASAEPRVTELVARTAGGYRVTGTPRIAAGGELGGCPDGVTVFLSFGTAGPSSGCAARVAAGRVFDSSGTTVIWRGLAIGLRR